MNTITAEKSELYPSIGQRNNNFDLLRLLAAISVIIAHCFGALNKNLPIFNIADARIGPSAIGLFIFFVISGYLVMQSLERSKSALEYFKKRALRIYPGLMACNVLCILILGIFFCSIDFKTFITEKETYRYLLNNTIFYRQQFYLPAVFDKLIYKNINVSIWTLRVELGLYIILSVGWLLNLFKSKRAVGIIFFLFLIATYFLHDKNFRNWRVEYFFNFSLYFFEGVIFYIFRDKILWKWYWPIVVMMPYLLIKDHWVRWLLLTFMSSYLVLYLARLKQLFPLKNIDLSYGLYIYAFPVQQCLLSILGYSINPWLYFLLTLIVTLPIALGSWKLIEKPFLRLK